MLKKLKTLKQVTDHLFYLPVYCATGNGTKRTNENRASGYGQ